ncbi:hypothetical protein ACFRAE_04160 [Sphingobacterium sp. HJSM2_6]|uniref:hypothetical protein n=1 Tax=Sphingobacterium sp. HJSM2_6 TaxID=3366264 RepID=UPI003BCD19E8
MTTIFSILLVLFVITILLKSFDKNRREKKVQVYHESELEKKANDKVILVKGPSFNDLKDACETFCKLFNKQQLLIIINLNKVGSRTYILTFPYDINFKHYCFMINYLKFSNILGPYNQIKGWLTTDEEGVFMNEYIADKKAMIYLPDYENPSGIVFLTTIDGFTFQLDLGLSKSILQMEDIHEGYQPYQIAAEKNQLQDGILIA